MIDGSCRSSEPMHSPPPPPIDPAVLFLLRKEPTGCLAPSTDEKHPHPHRHASGSDAGANCDNCRLSPAVQCGGMIITLMMHRSVVLRSESVHSVTMWWTCRNRCAPLMGDPTGHAVASHLRDRSHRPMSYHALSSCTALFLRNTPTARLPPATPNTTD